MCPGANEGLAVHDGRPRLPGFCVQKRMRTVTNRTDCELMPRITCLCDDAIAAWELMA